MIELTLIDLVKIITTVFGILMILVYKRRIGKMIENLVTDGDSKTFENVDNDGIEDEIRVIMDRVIR